MAVEEKLLYLRGGWDQKLSHALTCLCPSTFSCFLYFALFSTIWTPWIGLQRSEKEQPRIPHQSELTEKAGKMRYRDWARSCQCVDTHPPQILLSLSRSYNWYFCHKRHVWRYSKALYCWCEWGISYCYLKLFKSPFWRISSAAHHF